MPNKIDSTLSSYRQINSTTDRAKTGQNTARQSQGPRASDTVDVTASARELATLESAIRSASVEDTARVEAVRAQVADGSYQVDPQRVADNILGMDQALPTG